MHGANNVMPENINQNSSWTHQCEECGLPFMQSWDFHQREYHDN